MNPQTRRELQELLSLLCEDDVSAEQHERIETLLQSDVECRRFYVEYLDLHARLLVHPMPADGAATSDHVIQTTRSRPTSPAKKYALVAMATLAASLLIQFFLHSPPPAADKTGSKDPPLVAVTPPKYVATLTQSADCVWENPAESMRVGSRLLPGELRLQQGHARIDFDSGPSLVIEAPAVLRLESSQSAAVIRGKVFFKADETAPPFDLHTPTSVLVDLGTEYAVAVNPEGEEVYVFKGEVQRRPRAESAKLENLKAGEARRYASAPDSPPEEIPLDMNRFVRQVTDVPADPDTGLLAYEGFDYKIPDDFMAGKAMGGRGWASAWDAFLVRPLWPDKDTRETLDAKSLTRPGARSQGGSFDYTGFTKFYRRLDTSLRLDTDGVYYLSFLFRRNGPPADEVNAVAILFWTAEDYPEQTGGEPRRRLNIGVRGGNEVFTSLQQMGARSPLPLTNGETYLMVAKVVASAANADQVFMRVYGPGEPVENAEPGSWSLVAPPFQSDLVFDWLQLHINSKTRQTIDEVRLGTTWSSVTAAWINPAQAKK